MHLKNLHLNGGFQLAMLSPSMSGGPAIAHYIVLPCILETTKPALELTKDHEWPSYFSLPLLTFLVKVHQQQRQARGHVVVQEGSAMPAKVSGTWRILSRQATNTACSVRLLAICYNAGWP